MADVVDFLDVEPLRELAITLFNGWGYNVFRLENQLRADDLLVRSKAAWLLGRARADVGAAEADLRRERLAPPTRAQPFPDPVAVADAAALERMGIAIGALKGRIEAAPAPESDRMTSQYRKEAPTLAALIDKDTILVAQTDLVRAQVEGRGGAWLLANRDRIDAGLRAVAGTLEARQAILQSPV